MNFIGFNPTIVCCTIVLQFEFHLCCTRSKVGLSIWAFMDYEGFVLNFYLVHTDFIYIFFTAYLLILLYIYLHIIFCFLFFYSGGWNSRVISHSAVPQAGENDSVVSAWLAGDSSKSRLEATHMLPSQTLSVNSLDVLEQCLVCGTDGEAVYIHRQLPV